MSHQTGITASDDLLSFFATSKDGNIRLIKVSIKDEQLELSHCDPPHGSWDADFDMLIQPQLEDQQPCYILYRLDSQLNESYQWVFISYSPDLSPVRQKMLYAATRATLKKVFGGGEVKDEVFATTREEANIRGYRKHLTAKDAPPPLTMAEEELQMIKETEVKSDISVDTKHQTITGIAFPISKDAQQKLADLQAGNLNYVQLSIDLQQETINLAAFDDTSIDQLASRVPLDHARYHFFRFNHTHEGDYLQSIVFIYSMPGYKCSIKERMLYSSCKAPLLEMVEGQLNMDVVKKMEIDDPKEITEEFLQDELHPKKNVARQQFARPKGPAGRGPKRLTKPTKPADS